MSRVSSSSSYSNREQVENTNFIGIDIGTYYLTLKGVDAKCLDELMKMEVNLGNDVPDMLPGSKNASWIIVFFILI
jgi:hypothetical protein